MSIDEIPFPPKLTCDSRKCTLRSRQEPISTPYESRTPKDLPGDAKKFITPDSFFPFDDSSSINTSSSPTVESKEIIDSADDEIKLDAIPETRSSIDDSSSSSSNSSESNESLELPDVPPNTPISTVRSQNLPKSEREKMLMEYKIIPIRTFVINDADIPIYLVQMKSYYGDMFFVRFEEDISMGDSKIFLFKNTDDTTVNIISESMTKYVTLEKDLVTLLNDSLIYNGFLYSTANVPIQQHIISCHPSSHRVYPETSLDDVVDLSLMVHQKACRVEGVYRRELMKNYNDLLEEMTDFITKVQEHHRIFSEVDSMIIEETDLYYDLFAKKYKTSNPIPEDDDIKRISFLNETSLKYVQAHFIFWGRLKDRVDVTVREFNETINNIYLQNVRDFPGIEGVPLDDSIDIDRSYPGKIFTREDD